MKSIRSKYRTMTDNHLVACLHLETSCYTPDYEKLAPSSQWQVPTAFGGNLLFSSIEIHLFCIWFIFLFGSCQGHCLSSRLVCARVWERKSWRRGMWSLVVLLCASMRKCCGKLLQAGNDVYGFAMLTLEALGRDGYLKSRPWDKKGWAPLVNTNQYHNKTSHNLDLKPPCFIWRQGVYASQQHSFCLDYWHRTPSFSLDRIPCFSSRPTRFSAICAMCMQIWGNVDRFSYIWLFSSCLC